MTGTRAHGSAPEPARRRAPAAGRSAVSLLGTAPASVLALQRAAGNRATLLRLTEAAPVSLPGSRSLARCAGPCSCGGGCGTHDPELEEAASAQLRRAVAGRAPVR